MPDSAFPSGSAPGHHPDSGPADATALRHASPMRFLPGSTHRKPAPAPAIGP
ncbi:hypothetical protein C7S15_5086 [Burkholderia cepacia]|nr:hypothetical protein [Burkholderia cepacia]